jgi:hypothetical protein
MWPSTVWSLFEIIFGPMRMSDKGQWREICIISSLAERGELDVGKTLTIYCSSMVHAGKCGTKPPIFWNSEFHIHTHSILWMGDRSLPRPLPTYSTTTDKTHRHTRMLQVTFELMVPMSMQCSQSRTQRGSYQAILQLTFNNWPWCAWHAFSEGGFTGWL